MNSYETELRRISRVLSEIAHTLEASDHRSERVDRVLVLAREIIPSRDCAVLEVDGDRTALYVAPAVPDEERETLVTRLESLYRLVSGGDEIGRSRDSVPSLALPVMGLDEVIGVIRVEPDGESYDARHLRLLSVVGAQVGAYLAMARLRDRDAAHVKELAAAHDFQRVLAGVVGHDLRNPLAVIQTVAASLLENATDERQAKALGRALRNAESATRLITDLVDVTESRVNGAIRVIPADADFCEIVASVVEDLRDAHPDRRIDFRSVVSTLPGRCDTVRFTQIVTNLVNNALVHSDPKLPVMVGLREDHDNVVLTVQNSGPPIAPELLATIFDPFKQGAPKVRPHSVRGLGLGLYIVDRLTRGHGGDVHVTSSAQHGTIFSVRVPKRAAVMRPSAPRLQADSLVLIVDDDQDVRDVVAGVLQKRGYDTATAANGREALAQLRAGLRPGLILLDLQMPVMDGETFCEECARSPALAEIPIVVISSDTATAAKLAATHARAHLSKPVPIDRLLATLESLH
ncbi:MAG: response regulator [Deltaproteobacteria bacterium]|nr:response regulator [Deltaproteobacteria bacterium]